MFYIKGSFYIKGCDKACPQLPLLSTIFVFRADPSSKMAALAPNLLEHFYSAINGWILMKLDRKQFMNVCYHVCDFCADLSLKVTALFFNFLNHLCNCWTNLTKLNGEQVLNVVYQDCVFSSRYVNWNTTLASDWLVNAIFRPAFLYKMICCCFLLFYVTFGDISAI